MRLPSSVLLVVAILFAAACGAGTYAYLDARSSVVESGSRGQAVAESDTAIGLAANRR